MTNYARVSRAAGHVALHVHSRVPFSANWNAALWDEAEMLAFDPGKKEVKPVSFLFKIVARASVGHKAFENGKMKRRQHL